MTKQHWATGLALVVLGGCSGGKAADSATTATTTPGTTTTQTNVQPPRAENDLATVDEGNSVNINVANNDLVASNPLALGSVTVVEPPQFGQVVVQTNGTVDYTHDGSETTSDGFTYTIEDSTGVPSNVATVSISVGPINDPPVATADSGVVDQWASVQLDLAANDSDPDDGLDLGSIALVIQPGAGTVTVNNDGTVDYQQTGAGVVADSFTYTIADMSGVTSNEVTVDVTINTSNSPPIAQDDFMFVSEGGVSVADLVYNDIDSDDGVDPSTVVISLQPSSGSVVVQGGGMVEYTHDGSETLSDTFTYTVMDNSGAVSNVAAVQVAVQPVNDPPIAADDALPVTENLVTNLVILGNDNDVDDALDPASVAIVAQPADGNLTVNANGTVDYAHNGAQNLSDSFTYTVNDAAGATSNVATVDLTVNLVNDPPTAVDDAANVDEGSVVQIAVLANDTDSDDAIDVTSVTIASGPSSGLVFVNANGTVDYSHDGSETPSDSFSYRVNDVGGGSSNLATVNVTVAPVNDPPSATDDAFFVSEGTSGNTLDVAGNDGDVDDGLDLGSILIISPPARGTLFVNGDGTVDYDHDGTEFAFDSFLYTIADNSGAVSNAALATISIAGVNDPPVAAADNYAVSEGASGVNLNVIANDTDADDGINPGSVTIQVSAAYGTLAVNPNGTVDYSHDGSETLTDSFSYRVSDYAGAVSNTVVVDLSINPVNDPPVANDDFGAQVDQGQVVTINLWSNDTDVDDALDPGSIVIMSPPGAGIVTPLGNGTVDYAHDGGPALSDVFTYTIRDVSGATSNIATVDVTINPPACPGLVSFNFTGGLQTYVVPAGCGGMWGFDVMGAQGEGGNGGLGGYSYSEMYIADGQTLYINVGGSAGFNGGGFYWSSAPRSGGGASDVRLGGSTLQDRVVVAGGGGASAGDSNFTGGAGGAGLCGDHYCGGGGAQGYGGAGGNGGTAGGTGINDFHSGGAGGGGLDSGGMGSCNTGYTNTCGGTGLLGLGGAGDDQNQLNPLPCFDLGTAGGGGGFYGGGGSSTGYCGGGGGGGGSSYASSRLHALFGSWQPGNGQVTLFRIGGSAPVYVGSYTTNSGPDWVTTPPYTCQEACALNFGGLAADYECSTSSGYVDNRARLNGYGTAQFCDLPHFEDFKLNTTYNCAAAGCAFSAWNSDGWCAQTNHCWQ